MFDDLIRLVENVKRLDANLILKEVLSFKEVQDYIIRLNTQEQLYKKGIDSDGKKITHKYKDYKVYSSNYARKKKKLGLPTNRITLYLTGEFHKGWTVEVTNDELILKAPEVSLDSGWELTSLLRDFYGDFEGLTDENIDLLTEIATDEMAKIFKERISSIQ